MLQAELSSMMYRDNESVRGLIMRMKTVVAKLKRAGTDHSRTHHILVTIQIMDLFAIFFFFTIITSIRFYFTIIMSIT